MNHATLAHPRTIRIGLPDDRDSIYALRHDVYAQELGQHATREDCTLSDALDTFNEYVVVEDGDGIAGFVSLTPPGNSYSLDKYVPPAEWPFPRDEGLWEVRILTVRDDHRAGPLAFLLMYAALRLVAERGGTRVMAIGRREVLSLYERAGLVTHGRGIVAGHVDFELMSATVADLTQRAADLHPALRRSARNVDWDLPVPFETPAPCYHGGQFFDAIGTGFDDLSRRHAIVNADVLDAWFPPAPAVLAALQENLSWILRTSPPTQCEGMVAAIAAARGVPPSCVVPGAGSSDLIFAAFPRWLRRGDRVLLLDPTYGEYAFVLEQRLGCRVERFTLDPAEHWGVNVSALTARLRDGHFDLAVIVNPNSPTGRHVRRDALRAAVSAAPTTTRVWIDETYVEYVGTDASLETFAAGTPNVVVCKSMSKVYALSGARAAYLVAAPAIAADLRAWMPPWAVGLPGQIAAVHALASTDYYEARWRETAALRADLGSQLEQLGIDVVPGVANFLLCRLPTDGATTADVVVACRREGVYLRDVSSMGSGTDAHTFRTAVRSAPENERIVGALGRAM